MVIFFSSKITIKKYVYEKNHKNNHKIYCQETTGHPCCDHIEPEWFSHVSYLEYKFRIQFCGSQNSQKFKIIPKAEIWLVDSILFWNFRIDNIQNVIFHKNGHQIQYVVVFQLKYRFIQKTHFRFIRSFSANSAMADLRLNS